VGRQEEDDFVLVVRRLTVSEECAENGQVAENWKLGDGLGINVLEEATQNDRFAVVNAERSVNLPICDDGKRFVKSDNLTR